MKTHVPEERKEDIAVKLACGSVAGLLGQTLTYPLDVVRRQMQVPSPSPVAPARKSKCRQAFFYRKRFLRLPQVQALSESTQRAGKGTLGSLVLIVRRQGWRQLFSGLSINYLKVNGAPRPPTKITKNRKKKGEKWAI